MRTDLEFRKKRIELKKAWRKTEAGRESMRETARRYRKKNPDIVKKINSAYHERNKEKRLAQARAYKKRVRVEAGRLNGVEHVQVPDQIA